jgi:hypothetical protein
VGNLRSEVFLREIDSGQKRYVRRFLDLAAARGIRVVWLLPPADAESLAIWCGNGVYDRYPALLARLLAGRGHVLLVDARDSGYPRTSFHDLVHLNGRGALEFSAELADLLRRCESSAWAHAPGPITLVGIRAGGSRAESGRESRVRR